MKWSNLPYLFSMLRSGQFEEACRLFRLLVDQGLKPELITFNSMINACGNSNKSEEALILLGKMKNLGVSPDVISYNSAIKACAQSGRLNEAMGLLKEMQQQNLKADYYTFNGILAAYSRDGNIEQIVAVMKQMIELKVKPDEVSYLHAIDAARKSQRPDVSFQFYERMKKTNVKPSKQIFTSLMNACGSTKSTNHHWNFGAHRALGLLDEMESIGIRPDTRAYSSCLSVLASHGKAKESLALLEKMQKARVAPNEYSFSAVMKACTKVENWEAVLETYQRMITSDQCTPDLIIYQSVLKACAELGKAKVALDIVHRFKDLPNNENATVDYYNAALKSCEEHGNIDIALDIMDLMKKNGIEHDIITYNRAIAACQEHGSWKAAVKLLQDLKAQSLKPNVFTYTAVIRTCIQGNSSSSILQYLTKANEGLGMKDPSIYIAAIQAYHSFGMYDSAAEWFEKAVSYGLMGSELKLAVEQGIKHNSASIVIDLHGYVLPVANAAIRFTMNEIWRLCQETQACGVKPLEIVTGIGKHSTTQFKPTLRPEVQRMLVEEFYPPIYTSTKPGNSGRVLISQQMISDWIDYNKNARKSLMLRLTDVLQKRLCDEKKQTFSEE